MHIILRGYAHGVSIAAQQNILVSDLVQLTVNQNNKY
jgi:hypothetical protein